MPALPSVRWALRWPCTPCLQRRGAAQEPPAVRRPSPKAQVREAVAPPALVPWRAWPCRSASGLGCPIAADQLPAVSPPIARRAQRPCARLWMSGPSGHPPTRHPRAPARWQRARRGRAHQRGLAAMSRGAPHAGGTPRGGSSRRLDVMVMRGLGCGLKFQASPAPRLLSLSSCFCAIQY